MPSKHRHAARPMHADNVYPIHVGHGISDKRLHIMPNPSISLSVEDRPDGGFVEGRDR
jgi:hypothetical protein